MGTEIYTVNSEDMKPWYELVPNKIKKVLENPGPHDRLLVCVEEDIGGTGNGEREFFNNISGVEYTGCCDFDPNDYDELSIREPEKFFETHTSSVYCYDIPEMAITERSTFAFYNKVAKGLATLQITNRHFLICVSQEFGAHVMFLTNCDVCAYTVDKSTPKTLTQPTPQPKPLEWLTGDQYEILTLRLELLRRDFMDWGENDRSIEDSAKLVFGNSERFIEECRDGTLLDKASSTGFDANKVRAYRRGVLALQGLGVLCGQSSKADKILNMLKPYLDAAYALTVLEPEPDTTVKVEVNEEDSNNE